MDSPLYQDKYVKPYTLFPSAGKDQEEAINRMLSYPVGLNEEQREKWEQRMRETAPIRQRAKELLDEKHKHGDSVV